MCEGVIHCITNNSQIYTFGNDINEYGLYGNNENVFYDTPTINKKLNSLKIFDIYSGFRHCCGRDFNNNLYIWGYYFGGKPKIIDNKVRLFNCGNDCVIYCKENEKHILNYYNNKNQNIKKFDIGNDCRDIFCGNTIIVIKTYKDKILVINEFGIHQVHYYNKNGFKIDNLAVRYNEIFILLSNNKGEQLLLRYSPSNENNFTKTTFEFYERLYKINLKKKIKLIYSTSSHYINGIFFEIDCDEKEKNTYELKKDKIFTLINRNYKENKVSITKIKDLSEDQKNALSNMNNMENDWEGEKRNYSLESQSMINDLKNRNRTISYDEFFNGTAISEKNMNGIRNLSYIKIKEENAEDEDERRRRRLEQIRLKKERAKKIEEDEINKLKKMSDEKNKKKREEERKRQLELEKKRREEEEKRRKLQLEKKKREDERRKKIEEMKRKKREEEEEEERKRKEEEDRLKELERKRKEEEELERLKNLEKLRKEEEDRLKELERLKKEEEERKRKEELDRLKKEEEERKKKEELDRLKELERLKKEEEERKKKEEEDRLKELERLKKEEEERKRKEEEERLKNRLNTDGNKNKKNKFVNVIKDPSNLNESKLRGGKKLNLNDISKNRINTSISKNNKKNNLDDLMDKKDKKMRLKSKKKPEEQLMYNGRRVIKLKNKKELIDILKNADPKNDESIYYYIENNKEDMSDLLSPNDYFPFQGKNLIKVKGNKIIKNPNNKKNHPRITSIQIGKGLKKKKDNSSSDVINKYFNHNMSFGRSILSDSYKFDKARNFDNATRANVNIIPTERHQKKKLKMRLISEVKKIEKNIGELNLDDLSTRKNRIKSIMITDDNALKEFKEKISKFAPRKSAPDIVLNKPIKNIKFNLNQSNSNSKSSSSSSSSSKSNKSFSKEKKLNSKIFDNSSGSKGKMIKTYGYDLTKTYNTKILKPYELDD